MTHDRRAELEFLLEETRKAIAVVPEDKLAPLINTANRLSQDLMDLDSTNSESSTTESSQEPPSGVALFMERMRARDSRSA